MTPQADNALTALERARQAQERFERRIDVQLRVTDWAHCTKHNVSYHVRYGCWLCVHPSPSKR